MQNKRKNLLFSLFSLLISFFICGQAMAQDALVPSDTTYYTKSSRWIQYIYPRERAAALTDVDHYMQYFKAKYDISFKWALDEKVKMALASNQNQIANGFATISPFLQTLHYPAGTEILDLFAQDSFLFALASHETAHLYQLSAKSSLSSTVKSILGNTLYIQTPFVVPIFVFPNAVLPHFMMEGNAVMNESVVGHGGRLWSGEVRQQVLAQVRGGKTGPSRLINQNADYPLSEDYHYGGYFFAYLAERYGIDKTNQFYIRHAEREFWPFNINKTFRAHFGVSYTRLIHDFSNWLKPLADRHQPAKGTVLGRTFDRPHFNHDDQHIYFIENPNGRLGNLLYRFNLNDQKLTTQSSDLRGGKPFFIDGRYYVVSAERLNPTNIKYALYGEGLAPKPGTVDLIYQDIRGGHTLTVDANNSYVRASLMKDGQFLSESGTSAVLDDKGQAYYFRQVGDEHVMYRDRDVLFKYKGYYGFPMQVGANGEVYFIASSAYGASLYVWQNNQISRVLSADNVVEARRVKDNQFLVAAGDSDGYEIQLINADPKPELPAWYDYKLPNVAPPLPPQVAAESEALKAPEDRYSEFGQLRFSQANLQASTAGGSLSVLFMDPLWFNTLMIAGRTFSGDQDFALAYLNQRHRLGYIFSAVYQRDEREDIFDNEYDKDLAEVFFGLNYELFKWRRWNGQFRFGPTWKEEGLTSDELSRRYGVMAQMLFSYARHDGNLGYEPYRHLSLNFMHQTDASQETGRRVDSANGATLSLGGDVFKQTFLSLEGSWAVAEIDSIGVNYLKDDVGARFNFPTYLEDGDAQEVREFSASLKQVIDWSYYFPRFPLSVRRIAPFVAFKDTYTHQVSTFGNLPVWREEFTVGTEIEVLLLHIMATRLAPSFSTIKLGGSVVQDWRVTWGLSKSF